MRRLRLESKFLTRVRLGNVGNGGQDPALRHVFVGELSMNETVRGHFGELVRGSAVHAPEEEERAEKRKPNNSGKLRHGTSRKHTYRDHLKGLALQRDMD